jgi:hypothetical protein
MLDIDRIQFLIELLQAAQTSCYSIKSSPVVVPLFEVMIDLSLKLKDQFQQRGIFWEGRNNPSIKFLDISDALGNPKSVKLWDDRRRAENPQLAKYFGKLALDLIRIKNLQDLPKDLYSNGKTCKSPSEKLKPESYHFFRRTRAKRKNL